MSSACLNGKSQLKYIILFLIAVTTLGCSMQKFDVLQADISEIVVSVDNFRKINVINDFEQLQQIKKIWHEAEQIQIDELPEPPWTHSLDIKGAQLSVRWLYNSNNGYFIFGSNICSCHG